MAQAQVQPVSITLQHSPLLKVKTTSPRIDLPPGTTLGELLQQIGIPADHHRYLLIYANGRKQGPGYVLQQEDAVRLFLPVGGG